MTNIPAPPPPTSTPPPGETKNSEPAGDEPVRSETPAAPPSSSSQTNTVHQAGEGLHAASAPAVAGETSSRSSLDKNAGESARAAVADPTSIYRVGVGDVLDIRLLNPPANSLAGRSTLYTVRAGGVLEYPSLGDPIVVAGMTADEINARLTAELRRRAVHANAKAVVSVRDYASHTVLISGLVMNPGGKILQREAVPLYVVIADAQPRPEAAVAVLSSDTTGQNAVVDLSDTAGMNTLVRPGDVINVTARAPQFYYISGDVMTPGEKPFHSGITLTQAVLAAGGSLRAGKTVVAVGRQAADGRLHTSRYNLADIMSGKLPDPRLRAGDRVEVSR